MKDTRKKSSGRVGQKGELFPPKEVQEEAGLKPGDQMLYKADHGRIDVVKIPGSEKHSRGERPLRSRSKNSNA